MEFKDIKELILLVNATEITDFEMEGRPADLYS